MTTNLDFKERLVPRVNMKIQPLLLDFIEARSIVEWEKRSNLSFQNPLSKEIRGGGEENADLSLIGFDPSAGFDSMRI